MYLNRHISERLLSFFNHFPILVVSGARQVGKSTLLKHLFKESAQYVELDPVVDIEGAVSDPDLFLDNHRTPLIIDEIQYAPQLASALKRRIDKDGSPGQYILSGSQQWAMIRSLSESLAGRAVFIDLMHLSLGEIGQTKPLDHWICKWLDGKQDVSVRALSPSLPLYEQLWRGFLPKVQFLPENLVVPYLQSYERTYVERDIRTLAELADLQSFTKFFRLLCALSGQEINYAHLGREFGIHPQTTKRWISLLQATYQWFELPAYSGNTIKRLSSRPKGYITDTGMICYSQSVSTPNSIASHPLAGHLFETAVIGEIRKQLNNCGINASLYHWRAHSGAEVDCLIERDGILYPIEIKLGSHPTKKDVSGITAFRETFPHLHIGPGAIVAPSASAYPLTKTDWVIPWNALCS